MTVSETSLNGPVPDDDTAAEVKISAPVAEYLEKAIADSLKREIDQEENVVRSLPFFATSIGVLLASLGFVKPSLDKLVSGPFLWAAYGLAILMLMAISITTYYLFQATRRRQQYLPMMETAQIGYARDLTLFHQGQREAGIHGSDEGRDKAIVLDLRTAQVNQLAVYAESLRAVNLARLSMRARMFRVLCFAIIVGLAQVLYILILTHEPAGRNHVQAASQGPAKPDHRPAEAPEPTGHAGGGKRTLGGEGSGPDQRTRRPAETARPTDQNGQPGLTPPGASDTPAPVNIPDKK